MTELDVRESTGRGLGLFTKAPVRAGERVGKFELLREVRSFSELREDEGEEPDHCTMIDGRFFLVAVPERYLNHSCDPNVYERFDSSGNGIVALRDIAAESELTVDYLINNAGGDSWDCHCGAKRCRGRTGKSFFALPRAFQEEYAPLLAPWFVKAHAEKLRHLSIALPGNPSK